MPWRGPTEPGEFPTLGYIAADWIEENILITEGPSMGHPARLYDEQLMHVLRRYRINPEATEDDGNDAYQFGGSMVVRGQKWGKDPLLAWLDLFHAFGPCDFAGWDASGEPVGRPHPSPWVFVAATNDKQADNTWLIIKAAVESSALVDLDGVEVTQSEIRLPCGNPIERLTTTAFGRLGGRFTAGSLTENGLMLRTGEHGNSGKRSPLAFARTLLRSVGGLNGMWVAATNTWDPTERSHAQLVYEAKDPHTLVDAKISRQRVDLTKDEQLADELRYLYGDSLKENGGHVALQRLIRDCRNKASGESEVRRFFLSEILAGEDPLVEKEAWDAMQRPLPGQPSEDDDKLRAGEAITLGFDGSRTRDATVLTACRIRDGRLFHLRTWMPTCRCAEPNHKPDQCPDPRIDRRDVDTAVTNMFEAYEVWYLFGDPYKWQDYLDVWSARYPKRVVEQPTNVPIRMDAMIERFQTAAEAGELTHSGDPTLTDHVLNAAVAKGPRRTSKLRVDSRGRLLEHYLKVVRKRDGLLIDGSISALLALDARGQAVEHGATTSAPPPSPVGLGVDLEEPARGPLDDLPDMNLVEF